MERDETRAEYARLLACGEPGECLEFAQTHREREFDFNPLAERVLGLGTTTQCACFVGLARGDVRDALIDRLVRSGTLRDCAVAIKAAPEGAVIPLVRRAIEVAEEGADLLVLAENLPEAGDAMRLARLEIGEAIARRAEPRICCLAAMRVPGIDIKPLEDRVVAEGGFNEINAFAEVPGADAWRLSRCVAEYGTAFACVRFATEHVERGVDLEAIQSRLLVLGEAEPIRRFAEFFTDPANASKIAGQIDLKRLQARVIENGTGTDCMHFARTVAGANPRSLSARVAEIGTAADVLECALIEGADQNRLAERMVKVGSAPECREMVERISPYLAAKGVGLLLERAEAIEALEQGAESPAP